ncbi:MAG: restriction endonuclease [Candidatus Pacearchaeota archaeon]|jgi:hypothetical protein
MNNLFSSLEEEITFDEDICFEEEKIKEFIFERVKKRIESSENKGFTFEEIIYEFFEYMNIALVKTPKTRDRGIDGFLNFSVGFLGEVKLGLQIKYKLIDSTDVDLFLSSLKNAELQLGVIVCKNSRNLLNYELNSKIKSILLSRGISVKEKLLNEKVDINPVFVLKLNELIEIVASQIRSFIKSVYKK